MKLLEDNRQQFQQSKNDMKKFSGTDSTSKNSQMKHLASVSRENLRTEEGPLGQLSSDYKVKFSRDERDAKLDEQSSKYQIPRRTGRQPHRQTSTYKERLAEVETEKNKKD